MRNWLANKILETFYKGYLITATLPYTPNQRLYLTIDLGRLVSGDDNAVEYEIVATGDGGYLN